MIACDRLIVVDKFDPIYGSSRYVQLKNRGPGAPLKQLMVPEEPETLSRNRP